MTRHRLTLACALLAGCGGVEQTLNLRLPLDAYRARLLASGGPRRMTAVGPCRTRGQVDEELANLIRTVARARFARENAKLYVEARTEVSALYVDAPLAATFYCIGVVRTADTTTLVFQYNGSGYK